MQYPSESVNIKRHNCKFAKGVQNGAATNGAFEVAVQTHYP